MTERFSNIIGSHTLASHISKSDWVVLDCRFDLADPAAGAAAWRNAHIPGAFHADLERDLSAMPTPGSGRHPLPDPDELALQLSRWGIGADDQVVVYDDANAAFAARAWWLLRWLGHDHVAVLDGGLGAWRRAGLPLSDQPPARPEAQFRPRPRHDAYVDADQVAAALAAGKVLLDARAAQRFLGEFEPLDARAGHVPGAHNFPYAANLDADGCFLSAAELRVCYDAALGGRPPEEVICMCGSGVTACHNLLAMAIAGLPGAQLYAGSWSEWSADASRPVATGPDT